MGPHGLKVPQGSLSFIIPRSFPKFIYIESVMPSNHLILCRPLLLLPSIFPSIMVFSNELALRIRWPKYWNFIFRISPSNAYSELISFRIDLISLQSKGLSEIKKCDASSFILFTQDRFAIQVFCGFIQIIGFFFYFC